MTIETVPPANDDKTLTRKVTDSAKVAGEKISETAQSAAASTKNAAGKVGETVKSHPYAAAAAVGGVAAAAAGAVAGKRYYDKRKAREQLDQIDMPQMRDGEPEVQMTASDEPEVKPTAN